MRFLKATYSITPLLTSLHLLESKYTELSPSSIRFTHCSQQLHQFITESKKPLISGFFICTCIYTYKQTRAYFPAHPASPPLHWRRKDPLNCCSWCTKAAEIMAQNKVPGILKLQKEKSSPGLILLI